MIVHSARLGRNSDIVCKIGTFNALFSNKGWRTSVLHFASQYKVLDACVGGRLNN